jgi:hypothetical protein
MRAELSTHPSPVDQLITCQSNEYLFACFPLRESSHDCLLFRRGSGFFSLFVISFFFPAARRAAPQAPLPLASFSIHESHA